jgi:hypothetical protein
MPEKIDQFLVEHIHFVGVLVVCSVGTFSRFAIGNSDLGAHCCRKPRSMLQVEVFDRDILVDPSFEPLRVRRIAQVQATRNVDFAYENRRLFVVTQRLAA